MVHVLLFTVDQPPIGMSCWSKRLAVEKSVRFAFYRIHLVYRHELPDRNWAEDLNHVILLMTVRLLDKVNHNVVHHIT